MPENICIIGWYQYDWLNKHILESIKKSKSNVKQKNYENFWIKNSNASTDYKSKRIADAFEGRYVEYKSGKHEKVSMKRYVEKLKN